MRDGIRLAGVEKLKGIIMTEADKVLIEINGRLGAIEANLKDIRHSLYGNGQPGMVTRLSSLEHSHNACRAAHEEEKQEKKRFFDGKIAVLAAAAGAVPAIAWELLKIVWKK